MHSHTWTLVNAALRRYQCDCGAYGYRHPHKRIGVVAYKCQHKDCARDAVQVCAGDKNASRCGEHQRKKAA